MAAPIQKLAHLAAKLFGMLPPEKITKDYLAPIVRAMNSITADDVFLDPREIKERDAKLHQLGQVAPVTYMRLHEDNNFTMAVFVVKSGGVLPLHDHPGMHGVLKVLYGQAKVTSYTEVDHKPLPENLNRTLTTGYKNIKTVRRHNDFVLSEGDQCCILTPSSANFHEIRSETAMAVFLDILVPPYENEYSCHYYTELNTGKSGSTTWLMEVPQPAHYWCDTIKYRGPELLEQ